MKTFPTIRLTAQEERELCARMRAGDQEARERLALSVLDWACRLAFDFASRVYGCGDYRVDQDDLQGLAFLGVARALEEFDPGKGRLTTAVYFWVQSAVMNGLAKQPIIHVPKDFLSRRGKGVRPKRDDSSAERVLQVASIFFRSRRDGEEGQLNLDSGERAYADLEDREEFEKQWEAYEWAMRDLQRTNERAATALRLRLEHGLNLKETGRVLGVTKERARQILDKWAPSVQRRARILYHLPRREWFSGPLAPSRGERFRSGELCLLRSES